MSDPMTASPNPPTDAVLQLAAFLRERDEALGPYDEDDTERLQSAADILALPFLQGMREGVERWRAECVKTLQLAEVDHERVKAAQSELTRLRSRLAEVEGALERLSGDISGLTGDQIRGIARALLNDLSKGAGS